jgi:hypothetical protein
MDSKNLRPKKDSLSAQLFLNDSPQVGVGQVRQSFSEMELNLIKYVSVCAFLSPGMKISCSILGTIFFIVAAEVRFLYMYGSLPVKKLFHFLYENDPQEILIGHIVYSLNWEDMVSDKAMFLVQKREAGVDDSKLYAKISQHFLEVCTSKLSARSENNFVRGSHDIIEKSTSNEDICFTEQYVNTIVLVAVLLFTSPNMEDFSSVVGNRVRKLNKLWNEEGKETKQIPIKNILQFFKIDDNPTIHIDGNIFKLRSQNTMVSLSKFEPSENQDTHLSVTVENDFLHICRKLLDEEQNNQDMSFNIPVATALPLNDFSISPDSATKFSLLYELNIAQSLISDRNRITSKLQSIIDSSEYRKQFEVVPGYKL